MELQLVQGSVSVRVFKNSIVFGSVFLKGSIENTQSRLLVDKQAFNELANSSLD
jgi:hypothetical protein